MTDYLQPQRASLRDIRCFALDLDGTVYLGDELFSWTLPFLQGLRRMGMHYLFVTNNSSRSARDYYHKLRRMGIPLAPEQIYTSGDATIQYLKRRGGDSRIYLLGTEELHADFEQNGFHTQSRQPEYVVLGFDKTFNYEKFMHACRYIRAGVPFIATHPDLNCPMPDNEMIPDCGALSAAVTAATGVQPKFLGKPHKEMIDGILARAGVAAHELALVGDRLSTDIKAGVLHGILTVLVLSGETQRQDLVDSPVQPDIVVQHLGELLQLLEQKRDIWAS